MTSIYPHTTRRAPILGLALLMALSLTAGAAQAQEKGGSGLPLPRFVSLKATAAHLRVGPGTQYPIQWRYQRRYYPLEIIDEYDLWRKVRDLDGTEGWMHRSLLTGTRTAVITATVADLWESPEREKLALRAEAGVHGFLLACEEAWCQMQIAGRKGWLRRSDIWGVYSDEDFD